MKSRHVWLFDLDNTLHDAHRAFEGQNEAMTRYVMDHLQVDHGEASRLRQQYWRQYGATLLGLVRHHGVSGAHFLAQTHRLPGLEQRLWRHMADAAALRRLGGVRVILTNSPRAYAQRVLHSLQLHRHFHAVLCVEDMQMFGHYRPKPDKRMFRSICSRLKVRPAQCTLVEDTLDHQRSARALGMQTVWMQRYLKRARLASADGKAWAAHGPETSQKLHRRPHYVCAKIQSIQALKRFKHV
jgi:putative hydrolase of the HAD superfamily